MREVKVYYMDHHKLAIWSQGTDFENKISDPSHPLIADRYLQIWKLQKRNSLQALASGLLLSHVLGVRRDEQLVAGEHGKPELATVDKNEKRMAEGIDGLQSFSISHARDYTILAVMGKSQTIGQDFTELYPRPPFPSFGADIEEQVTAEDERKRKYHASIARKYFPEQARVRYQQASDKAKAEIFIEEWTALEAVLKAYGTGFAVDRERIEAIAAMYVVHHAMVGDHVIAVAAEDDFSIELQEVEMNLLQ